MEVGQFAVGEDNNALQNKNHPQAGGWLADKAISLRQHDLDQVVRVKRSTLLSACSFSGTPFSCELTYKTRELFCQYKNHRPACAGRFQS